MILTTYHSFDLLLTRAGVRYKAIVVDAPAGEESILFDPPFAADALPRLEGLARGVTRGATRQIGVADDLDATASLAEVGSRLFDAVFSGPVGNLLAASLASVAGEGAGLRLRLRFEADAAELALLPWETLYDPARGHFVGLGEASPVLRYLALPRSRSALPVKPPLRVLALLASPAGLHPLDVAREWQAIQDALAGLVADGKFVLERLASPTLDALQQRLLGEPVHILHFIGHGVFDEASQAGCLAFADARNRPYLVRGDDLAKLLRNHPAVRLAYLNACEGALASGGSVFTGVAQALVREGVPAAVAMQAEISDPGAIELARTFYTALAAGRPVDAALTQARVALSASGSGEWAIPVLFSRSPDNRLFDIRQVLPTPDCPYPGMVPFSEAQRELFFGRDREIEEGVERLRQHPFLAIVGPSGSGKSSLIYAGVIPALRSSRRFGPGEWAVKIMRPGQHPLAALAERLDSSPETLSSLALTERTLLFVDQFEELFTLAAGGEAHSFLDALGGLVSQPNLHILLTVRADFYPELMACSLWPSIKANRLELTPLGENDLWKAIVEPANRVGVTVDEALAVKLIADASGQKGVLPLVQETLVLLWDKVAERQVGLKAYQAMAQDGRSGLQVAIDRRASIVYDNLPAAAQAIARRIFLRLVQFGEGRADTRRQQTAADLRASGDDPVLFDQTLAKLTESRLLTASGEAGDPNRRVDIAHEALIAGWPRLQAWLGQRRTAEQTRRRLEGKAVEWVAADKRGGLLDEYELQEAENWLAGEDARELGYSQDLADLVGVSKDAIAQAAAEKEDQQRRELAQAQKLAEEQRLRAEDGEKATSRLRKRLIAATVAVAIAAIAFAAAAWFGVDAGRQRNNAEVALATATVAQGQAEIEAQNAREAKATAEANAAEAQRQADIAFSRQLAAQAVAQADRRVSLSALLSVQSFIVTDTVEARGSLLDLLQQYPRLISSLNHHNSSVNSVAFSPDGQTLASGSQDHTIILWNIADPAQPQPIGQPLTGHSGPVTSVVFSPDGQTLVSGSADETVILWDVANPAQPRPIGQPLMGHGAYVTSMAFSLDGQTLASGSVDRTIILWDVADPARARPIGWPFTGHSGPVTSVAFSPDGHTLASGNGDDTIILWDVSDPAQPRSLGQPLAGHSDNVNGIAFSPDGQTLASSGDDDIIILWDAADPARARPIGQPLTRHIEGIFSIAFSPDGKTLASGSGDSAIILWDVADPARARPIGQPLTVHSNSALSVAFSPDGQMLASGNFDGTITLWDVGDSAHARPIGQPLTGHTDYIRSAAFSPDGGILASGGDDGTIILWGVAGSARARPIGQPLTTFGGVVSSVAFSPDGRTLASGRGDSTIILWDVADPDHTRRIGQPLKGHSQGINSIAFSPDGQTLASGSGDGTIILWDVADPARARPIGQPLKGHSGIAFSPDGRTLASGGSDGTIILWDVADPARGWPFGQPLKEHSWSTNSIAFSPDGQTLASGRGDSTIILWDVADPAHTRRIGQPLKGHSQGINSIAFSPDGQTLASGSGDSTIILWDVVDRAQPRPIGQPLTGHSPYVTTVAFSPDGQTLASGGADDTIILRDVNPRSWVARACRIAGRNLSLAEWQQYMGDRPYQKTCPGLPAGDGAPQH